MLRPKILAYMNLLSSPYTLLPLNMDWGVKRKAESHTGRTKKAVLEAEWVGEF